MSKSVKLKNNVYIDSSGVSYEHSILKNILDNSLISRSLPTGTTSYKDITQPGIYVGSSSIGCPYTGTLIIFNRGSTNYRNYIFIRYDGLIWISTYWNGTTAYKWKLDDCYYEQHVETYSESESHYRQQYTSFDYVE